MWNEAFPTSHICTHTATLWKITWKRSIKSYAYMAPWAQWHLIMHTPQETNQVSPSDQPQHFFYHLLHSNFSAGTFFSDLRSQAQNTFNEAWSLEMDWYDHTLTLVSSKLIYLLNSWKFLKKTLENSWEKNLLNQIDSILREAELVAFSCAEME